MNQNQQQEPTITLTLPLGAMNRLLEGAAQLPYAAVAPLIHEVQRQVGEQLNPQPAAPASAAPAPAPAAAAAEA